MEKGKWKMADETLDPIGVNLFSAETLMLEAKNLANFNEESGLARFAFAVYEMGHGCAFGRFPQRRRLL